MPKVPNSYLIEDPEGFAPSMVLPVPMAILVSLMDGNRTIQEILDEFVENTHENVTLKDLEEVVAYFDRLHFLDSPGFAAFLKKEMETFLALPIRPAAMAGGAYEKEKRALERQLNRVLETPRKIHAVDGDRPFAECFPKSVTAAIVPHVDIPRGIASYGWGYNAFQNHSDAELFVIFGSAHNPMKEQFAFTTKDFDSPLGVLKTDAELVKRVISRFHEKYAALPGEPETKESADLLADEFVHRDDHAIEFQAIFLRHLANAQNRNVRIVPILVNTFQPFLSNGDVETPDENDIVRLFLDALGDELENVQTQTGKRVAVIASANLSHIGPMYGSGTPVDDAARDALKSDDTALLDTVLRLDSTAFWHEIVAQENRNNVCGIAPIYCTLKLAARLGVTSAQLLSYEQAIDEETRSCVSFASIAAGTAGTSVPEGVSGLAD